MSPIEGPIVLVINFLKFFLQLSPMWRNELWLRA